MKVFDMFSGCGGFHQAVIKAGMEVVAFCEIDKWAKAFYDNAFDTTQMRYFNDATKIDTRELSDFDLLCAGFPCQAFSIAGKRRGFEDSRGTMFFEVARILQDKRPRYFILENVKGLLNHEGGKTFQTILAILADIGLYSIEWAVLNSKHFGVPQNRERVFIVGYPRRYGIGKVFPLGETSSEFNNTVKLLGNVNPSGKGQNGNVYSIDALSPTLTCNKGEGLKVGTLRTHNDGRGFREIADDVCPCIPARAREDGSGQPVIIQSANSQGYEVAEEGDSINLTFPESKTRRGRVGKGYAQTLQTSGNMATYTKGIIRRLTPLECFRLQGFADEIFQKGSKGISDAQLYKLAGNSVTVNVVYEIAKRIMEIENGKLSY